MTRGKILNLSRESNGVYSISLKRQKDSLPKRQVRIYSAHPLLHLHFHQYFHPPFLAEAAFSESH
jgi:hypothetical protein